MKNLLESFAIVLVGFLSLSIVFFIIQYNMIEEDALDDITFSQAQNKEVKKLTAVNYLDSLEDYGDDVDVKVDATKENKTNRVVVKSGSGDNKLNTVVSDKSKASYMENLSNYTDDTENTAQEETVKKAMEGVKKASILDPEDPEKLENEEIVDEIGMAIDAALDDL